MLRGRLEQAQVGGLWLFGAVCLLSIALQNVAFLGLAAWVGLAIAQGRAKDLRPPFWAWLYLPFLAWALYASALSENSAHSLLTWRKWLLIAVAVYAWAVLKDRPRALQATLGSTLFFSALTCLGASLIALGKPAWAWMHGAGLHELLGQWTQRGDWRAVSGSGGYMVLGTGTMLMLAFFAGLASAEAKWRRPLPLACLAALALGLLLTQTRSAWMGAGVALLVLAILARWWRGLLWGMALALALFDLPGNPIVKRVEDGLRFEEASTRERWFMQHAADRISRLRPWTGVGDALEGFEKDGQHVEGWYVRVQKPAALYWGFPLDVEQGHLHSNARQILVMYGKPARWALGAFALLLLLLAFQGLGSAPGPARGLLAALLAFGVNGMNEYNLGSFQSGFTLCFLIGLGLAAIAAARRAA